MKKLLLLCLALACSRVTFAQQNSSVTDWDAIEKLFQEQSYNTAYTQTAQAFAEAEKAKDSRNIFTGAWYLARIEMVHKEDAYDSIIYRYLHVLPLLDSVDKALCYAQLANVYYAYMQSHLASLFRNAETDEEELDYKLWTEARFEKTVQHYWQESLAPTKLLQNTDIKSVERFCYKGSNNEYFITPTLYDMLMQMAIDRTDDKEIKLQLNSQLMAFHAADKDDFIRIYLDHQRLSIYGYQGNLAHDKQVIVTAKQATQTCINRYRGTKCDYVTQFYALMAQLLYNNDNYVEAARYCDTAIALFPNSEGAVACKELLFNITQPEVTTKVDCNAMTQREALVLVSYRNTNRLYFRIVKSANKDYWSSTPKDFAKLPVLKAWNQEVQHHSDYRFHDLYCTLPAMPAGKYYLLISTTDDFVKGGCNINHFTCCDALLLTENGSSFDQRGYLIDRITGKPITSHKVVLQQKDKKATIETCLTDQNGFYQFNTANNNEKSYYTRVVKTTYQGVTIEKERYYGWNRTSTSLSKTQGHIYLDRPIYRPSETINFSVLVYTTDHKNVGETLPSDTVVVKFYDVNHKEVSSLSLTLNSYGAANGSFALPDNAHAGRYSLRLYLRNKSLTDQEVRVEVYKQPKFMITLDSKHSKGKSWQLGDEVVVQGTAASYSAAPISAAKVTYRVVRSQMIPFWRWWFMPQNKKTDQLTSGELTTDSEGHFSIPFTAIPDSTIKADTKPCFEYTIFVDVTDLNGETHSQQHTLHLGYENSYIHCPTLADRKNERFVTLPNNRCTEVPFFYADLNGNPLEGTIAVTVDELSMPTQPHLRHALMSDDIPFSIPQEQFQKQFPLMAYCTADLDVTQWEVKRTVLQTTTQATKENAESCLHLPLLATGLYRITLTSDDSATNTFYVGLLDDDAKQPLSQKLLWSDVSHQRAEVGEVVTFRVGSRHKDVVVQYVLSVGDSVVERNMLTLSEEIATLRIPVTQQMLGGFDLRVLSVKENIALQNSYHVEVPYTHKQLNFRLVSFRNKLQPGAHEQWTLQTSEPAQQLLTLYDAALDTYGALSWGLSPWLPNACYSGFDMLQYQSYDRWLISNRPQYQYRGSYPTLHRLQDLESMFGYGYRSTLLYECNVVKESSPRRSMKHTNGAVGGVYYADAANSEVEETTDELSTTTEAEALGTAPEPQVRQNLSPSAFFKPMVQTDSKGLASISFTVPELLTQWNLRGLAWTPDLKVGSLFQQVVTQKDLMVQPNVPRFLRQGDSINFLAKVVNISDTTQPTNVTFTLTNAANGNVVVHLSQSITLAAHSSQQVVFPIAVPQQLYLSTYRIVAAGNSCSDGEQGSIPVLSNRQLVTESVAMWINGKGEKQFSLPHLTHSKSTTSVSHSLTVEATANPLWYAIQALPYVAEKSNPSSIYRFNAYYANALAAHIVKQNPTIAETFALWQQDTITTPFLSNLEANAEVKQTVIEETPWLSNANSEQEQKRMVARYFDTIALQQELNSNLAKLMEAQLSNGGWSWMPADMSYRPQASLYITEYLLQGFGQLLQTKALNTLPKQLTKALKYVDQETFANYAKWTKENPKVDHQNLDYLYLRSFYPSYSFDGKSRKAYDYYYSMALKHRNDPASLYSLAQLAVVFYRHGDVNEARQVVNRLKESALYSEEMGMYWRDNVAGYLWHERPIEVQSMLILAFAEVTPNDHASIAQMQQWLLKQKQTTHWGSEVATADAITALMVGVPDLASSSQSLTIKVGSVKVATPKQAGSGYQSQRWSANEITPKMGNITLTKSTDGIAWGAAYWQYFEDLDKIPYNEMGIKLQRQYYKVAADGTLLSKSDWAVGDRVRVRILIDCDRNLEYLELKDGRASCFEPVSTTSGWRWNGGLSFYAAVGNASNNFYIDRLNKGKYILEYDLWVTNPGTFITGITTMQCMYAPAFRSNTPATKITIKAN